MTKLPILMYHNVCECNHLSRGLTISKALLEEHLNYIVKKGYTTLFFDEINRLNKIPEKSVVISFDDVTENQLKFAYPLLKKYNCKATFFIPFKYVNGSDDWNDGRVKIMSLNQLKSLDSNIIELGHHSFAHNQYSLMSNNSINEDILASLKFVNDNQLKVVNAMAYPYGKFPREKNANTDFKTILKKNGFFIGLRIGNRVNKFPFKDPFEVNRIDIKGEDSLFKFKIKLKYGKLKLF